jgi:hypothetical protein
MMALVSSTRMVLRLMEDAFQYCFPKARPLHILDRTLLEDWRHLTQVDAQST